MGGDKYRDQIVTCDVSSKLVSCAFSPIPISPLSIQRIFHLLVSSLFLLFSNNFYVNFALGQEAIILYSRAMSREATQCAWQCYSRNLHNLAEPDSLFGCASEGLEATHAT